MMEIRHLRSFIAVAEELHFGRAAARLHMAQSPLSQHIRRIERELGVELLTRGHHVVGLTDAGRVFLAGARRTVAAMDETDDRTRRAARGEVGTIVVGYVSEVTVDLLPMSLKAFKESRPDIEVDLKEGTTGLLLDALRSREVDVIFARSPASVAGLRCEQLVNESLMAALPSDDAPDHLRLADLSSEHFVMPTHTAAEGLRHDIDEACSNAGFRPRVSRETSPLSAVLLLVAAGAGVAVIPASVAHLYPVPGLHYARLTDPEPVTTAGVAWRRGEDSRIVEKFLQVTRDLARSHSGDQDVWPERHIVGH
jgi:DNA-binding transcriptional LysR family regulator